MLLLARPLAPTLPRQSRPVRRARAPPHAAAADGEANDGAPRFAKDLTPTGFAGDARAHEVPIARPRRGGGGGGGREEGVFGGKLRMRVRHALAPLLQVSAACAHPAAALAALRGERLAPAAGTTTTEALDGDGWCGSAVSGVLGERSRVVFELGGPAGGGISPAVLLLSVLGGFALAKTAVYWRVQFITAAMIAKHVPPGAKRVLEYGVGQGRNLYYYPKGTGMVVGVDPDAKEDLLIQVSVAAGVPFVSRTQPLEANNGQPDGTLDAVVTTGALRRSADPEAIVREAGRALKPGAPLVFVEDMSFGKQGVLEALTSSTLFEPPQYDDGWATLPLSPVAIGVAVRKGAEAPPAGGAKQGVKDDFETSTGLSGKRGKRRKGK